VETLEKKQLYCAIAIVTSEMIQRTRKFYLQNEYVYTNRKSTFRTYALKHLLIHFTVKKILSTLEQ